MNFEEYKKEAFAKNPELKKEYDSLAPEYELKSQIIKTHITDPFFNEANTEHLDRAVKRFKESKFKPHDLIED